MQLSPELTAACLALATRTGAPSQMPISITPGPATNPTATARQSRKGKGPKYRNRAVTVDGVRFDSTKEYRRWVELVGMQAAGAISGLRRQVRIPVRINGVVVCRYVADAVYQENGRRVVEDTKSAFTRKLPVYRLKKKLLAALYGIEVRET